MISWITARNVSVLYLVAYLSVFHYVFPPDSAADAFAILARQALYFFVPLMCIWYGDEVEDYVGIFSGDTPGWILKLAGWVLLLLPAVIKIIVFSLT